MNVEPMKPVDSWNIDDWRNAFNTLSAVHRDNLAYDYKVMTAIANAIGAPPFDGRATPDEWADAIIATAAALRAELDALRAELDKMRTMPTYPLTIERVELKGGKPVTSFFAAYPIERPEPVTHFDQDDEEE